MVHVEIEDSCFLLRASFVGMCSVVECDGKWNALCEGVSDLQWREPLWLRICPDEVEIGIGGVWSGMYLPFLNGLEVVDDPLSS